MTEITSFDAVHLWAFGAFWYAIAMGACFVLVIALNLCGIPIGFGMSPAIMDPPEFSPLTKIPKPERKGEP